MHPIIEKTFGGLSTQYYFRQFVFGLAMSALVVFLAIRGPEGITTGQILFVAANTFLYPYSRFVYESIVGFIVGDNVLFGCALVFFAVKFFTMMLCWAFAIFIAPLGLAYLYYHHSKEQSGDH